MNLTKNIVQFRQNFVNLPSEEADNNILAMTVAAEVMQFGFILSEDAIKNLANSSETNIITFHDEIISYLKEMTGTSRSYSPFWKGFPQEVMEKTEAELWLHQIIHYWSNGSYEPSDWTKERPTAGTIDILGKRQQETDRVGMVFQQYSSLPWRTVLDNICIALELQGIEKEERITRGREMCKLVGLEGQEDKYAQYPILSGGQLQRVALARNLITKEPILLLDEPHGALDMKTKLEMDDLLFDIWTKIMHEDPTFMLVTHDVSEAVYLSKEIIIMDANPGRIVHRIEIDLPYTDKSIKRTKKYIDYVSAIEDIMMGLES